MFWLVAVTAVMWKLKKSSLDLCLCEECLEGEMGGEAGGQRPLVRGRVGDLVNWVVTSTQVGKTKKQYTNNNKTKNNTQATKNKTVGI